MLTGGFGDYPDGVLVVEGVALQPIAGGDGSQVLLSGAPTLYAQAGGQVVGLLPFDATGVDLGSDGTAIIEEAMMSWVAFRHMTRS